MIRGRSRSHITFAINPKYKQEPEFINIEVELQPHGIGTYAYDSLVCLLPSTNAYIPIDNLTSLVGFQGFFVVSGMKMRLDEVATHMAGKPYARFRKEEHGINRFS